MEDKKQKTNVDKIKKSLDKFVNSPNVENTLKIFVCLALVGIVFFNTKKKDTLSKVRVILEKLVAVILLLKKDGDK